MLFTLNAEGEYEFSPREQWEAVTLTYIPAGAPHFYEVVEAPFEFLCMVPNGPDRIEILEGGKAPSR